MGKVFSCLPCKKRDSCTGKLPRKERARPEKEKSGCLGRVRGKEHAERERSDDVQEILVNRASRDADALKVEDIEHAEDQKTYTLPEPKQIKTNIGQKCISDEDASPQSSSADFTHHRSVDSGLPDVIHPGPPSDPTKTDDRRWSRIQDTSSPRRGAKDSDSTLVSLRQTREDYTKRLTRQRSMTRALLESRSPSPYHRRQLAISLGKPAVDTDNSQGDTIQKDTDTSKHSKHPTVMVDHIDDVTDAAKEEQRADDTSSDTVSNVYKDPTLSLKETENAIREEGIKQIEDEFFQEFPTGDVELTPVPSFLKITGDGDVPTILKEENLKCLEKTFFKEFPVDDLKVDLEACKEEIIGCNAACDSNFALKEESSDAVKDDVNDIKITDEPCDTPDEDYVEIRNNSSEDKTKITDPVGNEFIVKEDNTICVEIDDSTDEIVAIFQLAKEFSEQRNMGRKKKLQLLKKYKTHDLRPILENTVGERKAESRDVCLNIIDMCLDKLVPNTSADHWCSNTDFDVINPDDEDDSETSDEDESATDDRLVKLATLFENTIEEEREECEDFCFSLVLQCVGAIDYSTHDREGINENIKAGRNIVNKSKDDTVADKTEGEAVIRRIRSDTAVIIAIDINGNGHPRLAGSGNIVAMDRNGIGHIIYTMR